MTTVVRVQKYTLSTGALPIWLVYLLTFFVVMALNACSEKFLACIIYLRGVHMLSDSKTCQDICLIKFALVNVQ